MRTAYSKRQYIYTVVSKKAMEMTAVTGRSKREMVRRAAEILDDEHGTMTMAQYLVWLKREDPMTKKRQRQAEIEDV